MPLHIRNAPTRLMKDLGYCAEYKYEPSFAHPVHQDFFPPELLGTRFVSPPPPDLAQESRECDSSSLPCSTYPKHILPTQAGTGPSACQRQFQLGSRAVNFDFLLEWEQKHNKGKPWVGRVALERRIARASGEADDTYPS